MDDEGLALSEQTAADLVSVRVMQISTPQVVRPFDGRCRPTMPQIPGSRSARQCAWRATREDCDGSIQVVRRGWRSRARRADVIEMVEGPSDAARIDPETRPTTKMDPAQAIIVEGRTVEVRVAWGAQARRCAGRSVKAL